jgi:hypothetical protein
MIGFGSGKGQHFADEMADTLTKRTVPAFLVDSLSSFLADTMTNALGENCLISLP